jgi:hypothetical protein
MCLARVVLGSQEAYPQKLLEVSLDQMLKGFLKRDRFACQFLGLTFVQLV